MAGVKKSHTTPYHPMGNGITERFNRTFGVMIRSLPLKSKARWPQMLQTLTFCYNCTEHETTGFAPCYLMFGRVPRLPVDVMFQNVLADTSVVDRLTFVSQLKKDLSEAARIAQKHSLRDQTRHANLYNSKVRGSPLAVGDRVLLANRGERGKGQVADKWDSTLYEVISVAPDINLYRIKDLDTAREKIVHRNLLLAINFLPIDGEPDQNERQSESECEDTPKVPEEGNSNARTLDWLRQVDESNGNCSEDLPDVVDSYSQDGLASDLSEVMIYQDSDVSSDDSTQPSIGSVLDSPVCEADPVGNDRTGSVVCTQPRRIMLESTRTRVGRLTRPPKRLICEVNDQIVTDSVPSGASLFSFVRSVFAM